MGNSDSSSPACDQLIYLFTFQIHSNNQEQDNELSFAVIVRGILQGSIKLNGINTFVGTYDLLLMARSAAVTDFMEYGVA